ncbi:MAG: hypothetical protein IKU17_06105, partial [Clostridia bacterium]|nr:hypothetical protein [Clostridia bacterium]
MVEFKRKYVRSFDRTFSKGRRVSGQRPDPTFAMVGISLPWKRSKGVRGKPASKVFPEKSSDNSIGRPKKSGLYLILQQFQHGI